MEAPHLKLISPMPPSVNHYLAYRSIIKNGRAMSTSYCTTEAKKYKTNFAAYVIDEVKNQGWDLEPNETQHFYVDTVFYFSTIASDPNNYFKCMLDAITDTQKIWLDDNVVCERVQGIYYDTRSPRVELCIHPVDYIGIFQDINALTCFETNCHSCARYARNCSLLRKAKSGKIQDEILNGVCTKYSKKGD